MIEKRVQHVKKQRLCQSLAILMRGTFRAVHNVKFVDHVLKKQILIN